MNPTIVISSSNLCRDGPLSNDGLLKVIYHGGILIEAVIIHYTTSGIRTTSVQVYSDNVLMINLLEILNGMWCEKIWSNVEIFVPDFHILSENLK